MEDFLCVRKPLIVLLPHLILFSQNNLVFHNKYKNKAFEKRRSLLTATIGPKDTEPLLEPQPRD